MKASAIVFATLLSCCAAREMVKGEKAARASSTCSIGIARLIGRVNWDITVYNIGQADRQDVNIIATLKNAHMDKGQNITIQTPIDAITISNIDNTPAFAYDKPEIVAPIADPTNGLTKVELHFTNGDTKFTTDDCGAGSSIFSGGRESWSCDFPCTISSAKEL